MHIHTCGFKSSLILGLMMFLCVMTFGCSGKNVALYHAVYNSDTAKASELLAKGFDPDIVVNEGGWRPVLAAVLKNNNEILIELLKAGANPNATLKTGSAAIHFAAEKKDTIYLETLLRFGADVNLQNQNGVSPLYAATSKNNPKAMTLLLNAGADMSLSKHNGWTPLHMASYLNRPEAAQTLVDHGATLSIHDHAALNHVHEIKKQVHTAADANRLTPNKLSPLHFALKNGHMDLARYLISKGADVTLTNDEKLYTTHLAALWSDTAMMGLLMDKGASINAAKSDGYTALHLAASKGHVSMVLWLISRGAGLNTATKTGETALYSAAVNNKPDVVRALIKAGADSEAKHNGWTPLRVSANKGFTEVVKSLLAHETIQIDADNKGATALYLASYKGYDEIVESLLKKGADPSKGFNGWTCLHGAAHSGSLKTARHLLDHKADVTATISKTDLSPLDIAYDQLKDPTIKTNMLTLLTGYYGESRLALLKKNLEDHLTQKATLILNEIVAYYHHKDQQSLEKISGLNRKIKGKKFMQQVAKALNKSIGNYALKTGDGALLGQTYANSVNIKNPVDRKTAQAMEREILYEKMYAQHKQTYQAMLTCIDETSQGAGCIHHADEK